MNCKNCEYAIKHRNLQDNEWYTRCTYEEGECVKITELETQIEKMKCCGNCKYYTYWGDEQSWCTKLSSEDALLCDVTKSKWEIKEND